MGCGDRLDDYVVPDNVVPRRILITHSRRQHKDGFGYYDCCDDRLVREEDEELLDGKKQKGGFNNKLVGNIT